MKELKVETIKKCCIDKATLIKDYVEDGVDYVTSEGFADMINGLSQSKKPLVEILHSLNYKEKAITDTKNI
jgi:hypothetical protein